MNEDLEAVMSSVNRTAVVLTGLDSADGPFMRLKKYIEHLEQENSDTRERVVSLHRDYTDVVNRLTEESNRVRALEADYADLAARADRCHASTVNVEDLKDRNRALSRALTVAEERCGELEEALKFSKTKVADLEQKLAFAEKVNANLSKSTVELQDTISVERYKRAGYEIEAKKAVDKLRAFVDEMICRREDIHHPLMIVPGGMFHVSVRLPEPLHNQTTWSASVLGWRPLHMVWEIVRYVNSDRKWYGAGAPLDDDLPTHWCPLPAPPKGA